jgi:GNAT superfamily N-acetyltransferase
MLEEWSTVIIKGWWSGEQERVNTLCPVYRHLYQRPDMTLWLARVGGTALSFRTRETIGLYMITLMPELRGKGYGYQLTLQPMLAALEQGCRHGVLYATPERRRVYEMLGFREVSQARIYFLPGQKEGD